MNRTETSTSPQAMMATAALPALLITFLLFVLMQQLISSEVVVIRDTVIALSDDVVEPRKDSPPKLVVRPLPDPPKPVVRPQSQIVDTATEPGPIVALPTEAVLPVLERNHAVTLAVMDKSASAVVRIDPKYPPEAARDGIEGWVKLSFSVDQSGAVTDVVVLDAQPKRIFDREAIKALKSWKYQPQIQQGKAVMQRNMQVQLDFSLDKA